MKLDFEATMAAIQEGVVGWSKERAVIRVSGPDAVSYVQGQVSQDVSVLAPGDSVDALLLSPQGKLDAYVRVAMRSFEELLVDVEPEYAEVTLERLRRFKLRVKVTLELTVEPMVMLRGPDAVRLVAPGVGDTTFAHVVAWPALVGVDLIGDGAVLPVGVGEGDDDALEVARIKAGWPVMGRELDAQTIAAAAGLVERTVSFTKGCYTGQELVARLDSRGSNVPFRLFELEMERASADVQLKDSELRLGDKKVGNITSAAFDPEHGRIVALGYVHRDVEVPGTVLVDVDGVAVPISVSALPT